MRAPPNQSHDLSWNPAKRTFISSPKQNYYLISVLMKKSLASQVLYTPSRMVLFKKKKKWGTASLISFISTTRLIIANKEENVKSRWRTGEGLSCLDQRYQKSFICPRRINKLDCLPTRLKDERDHDSIKKSFSQLPIIVNKPACYLIWKDPYMTVKATLHYWWWMLQG
jgi:hypothetical protein